MDLRSVKRSPLVKVCLDLREGFEECASTITALHNKPLWVPGCHDPRLAPKAHDKKSLFPGSATSVGRNGKGPRCASVPYEMVQNPLGLTSSPTGAGNALDANEGASLSPNRPLSGEQV